MGFITKIEQGLEKAVRGTFAKGGSNFEPVDLANRVRTEMDNQAYSISLSRTIAPNIFTLEFAADDFPRVQAWGAPLAEELCDVVIRHARSQRYSLRGSVRVTFAVSDAVEPGDFVVQSVQEKVVAPQEVRRRRQGAPAPPEYMRQSTSYQEFQSQRQHSTFSSPEASVPSAYPASGEDLPQRITRPERRAPHYAQSSASAQQAQPVQRGGVAQPSRAASRPSKPQVVLEINGRNYSCHSFPVVLGRSSHADITVEDTGVSRRHLEIIEQEGTYLAVDLGSTNGSYVNGEPLRGRRALTNGSVLGMGRARIIFRLVPARSDR